ncbi:MAG: imidazolonepropionase [Salibacteraceae bacterium]
MHKRTLIKNIKELVLVEYQDQLKTRVVGQEMNDLNVLENAWLAVEDELIVGFGLMDEWEGISDWRNLEVIDATGRAVIPAFCDSHTHIVYHGNRENEWVDRLNGLTYEEIANKGGGIINSALNLRSASEEELFEQAMVRANEIISQGTGAVEIKSGYGLSLESELKMLRVIKRLKEETPLTIKSTLLAAHAIPPEFKNNKEGYVNHIINDIIPAVQKEELADNIDIFCEKGYFDNDDTQRILEAGINAGLEAKYHVNQFTISGGVEVGVNLEALSVDHLEVLSDAEIDLLKDKRTISTLLPSCSFFLEIPYSPARKMIDAGLSVALATDYNPGSTPSGKMPFVMSLACIKMKMKINEVYNAACLNGAYAMGLSSELGSIAVGKRANLLITKKIPSYSFIPYGFGGDHLDQIMLNGKIIS